ncbi:MAG: hypothetical protein IKM76_12490 [Prevotella sp.]|nr:hypothetical protein [Prevotella sp.]
MSLSKGDCSGLSGIIGISGFIGISGLSGIIGISSSLLFQNSIQKWNLGTGIGWNGVSQRHPGPPPMPPIPLPPV